MKYLLKYLLIYANRIFGHSAPKMIGEFRLERVLKLSNHPNYVLAIYKKHDTKYFAKIWQGVWHDLNYDQLQTEYQVITALFAQLTKASDIRVPELVSKIESPHQLALIYEYLDGKLLDSLPKARQNEIITRVEAWLASLTPPLIHGDLTADNIIVKDHYIYVLDWEKSKVASV